jgi:hypothetical protein
VTLTEHDARTILAIRHLRHLKQVRRMHYSCNYEVQFNRPDLGGEDRLPCPPHVLNGLSMTIGRLEQQLLAAGVTLSDL